MIRDPLGLLSHTRVVAIMSALGSGRDLDGVRFNVVSRVIRDMQ